MKKILILLTLILCQFLPVISSADVWEKYVIDSTGTSNGANCAIALDSEGNPHISYCNLDNLFLYYAKYNGTSWSIESVDSFGMAGLHTSIAIDSLDNPHISYTGHGFNLRYAYYDGSVWFNRIVDSGIISPGMQGFRTSIALDYKQNPHIAYSDDTLGAIMYAKYDGDQWNFELIQDITETFYLKLILRNDSIPYIGYHIIDEDLESDTLRMAYWENSKGSWQFTDVQDSICPTGIFYQSFDMDSDGNCYFAYETKFMPGLPCMGMGDKKIAKFDGGSWSYKSVPKPDPDPYEYFPTFPLFLKMDRNNNPAFLADTILYWKKDGIIWSYYGLGDQMGENGVAVFQH